MGGRIAGLSQSLNRLHNGRRALERQRGRGKRRSEEEEGAGGKTATRGRAAGFPLGHNRAQAAAGPLGVKSGGSSAQPTDRYAAGQSGRTRSGTTFACDRRPLVAYHCRPANCLICEPRKQRCGST